MKNLKKADIIAIVLCLCAVIPGAAVWSRLPERVTTHWNINGEPDGAMPKALVVFGLPVIFAVLTLICCFFVRRFEAKQGEGKTGTILRFLLTVTLYFVQALTLLSALGKLHDTRSAASVCGSVFMILLGNYLPKVRRNGLVGIRTPHTMASETVWHRTHRMAGITVTAGGVLMLAASVCGYYAAAVVILLAALVIPTVYGEIVYYSSRDNA